jgi:hypothetical protein
VQTLHPARKAKASREPLLPLLTQSYMTPWHGASICIQPIAKTNGMLYCCDENIDAPHV